MSTGYLKQGKSVKAKDWEAEFRSIEAATETLERAGKLCLSGGRGILLVRLFAKRMTVTPELDSYRTVAREDFSIKLVFHGDSLELRKERGLQSARSDQTCGRGEAVESPLWIL